MDTCIPGFAAESHEVVLVQISGLVICSFEDGCAAHGGFGGGDDGEVAACYAEQDLHLDLFDVLEKGFEYGER